MINITAKCDSPVCDTVTEVKAKSHPDAWTVIKVERSRITGLRTEQFAFCSADCLSNWAYEFVGRE